MKELKEYEAIKEARKRAEKSFYVPKGTVKYKISRSRMERVAMMRVSIENPNIAFEILERGLGL